LLPFALVPLCLRAKKSDAVSNTVSGGVSDTVGTRDEPPVPPRGRPAT